MGPKTPIGNFFLGRNSVPKLDEQLTHFGFAALAIGKFSDLGDLYSSEWMMKLLGFSQ